MRIGYSYWGFLGDHKLDAAGNPISSPDGNSTYSWSIVYELMRQGHTVYAMQQDRDAPAYKIYGVENFSSFSKFKRAAAYRYMNQTHGEDFPELDVLLVEWRFPVPGRNTPDVKGRPEYQDDLRRQHMLLEHYAQKDTKVILWDLDHKLTYEDEDLWSQCYDTIFETSVKPLDQHFHARVRVEPPFVIEDLLQFRTLPVDPEQMLAYVGSRYERDDVIDQYIRPVSDKFPGQVHFYGNWSKTLEDCKRRWPNVSYHDRITARGFSGAYGRVVACPLIAKRSYLQTGFVTPRVWETLLFGTIPVGLSEMNGINEYVFPTVVDGEHMIDMVSSMSKMSLMDRDKLRHKSVEKIEFMDARNFVKKILEV
jgi:hypothetical protein